MSISFAGGSFIGICYYMGCCSYLQGCLPDDVVTLGSSAGAWAALAIQARHRIDLNDIKKKMYSFMDKMGTIPISMEPSIVQCFDDIFRDLDPTTIPGVRKRLRISVSRLNWGLRNQMLHDFTNKADLRRALIQSSRLPVLVGSGWTIDGGLTRNQPTLDRQTIKINCITRIMGADISPSRWINPCHIITPPSIQQRERLFCMGFEDTKRWFEKNE